MGKGACCLCDYWEPHGDGNEGTCVRYPPVLNVSAAEADRIKDDEYGMGANYWSNLWSQPVTEDYDSCGEFVKRK